MVGEKIIIPVGLLAALLYAIGGPWDQLIHVHQGHTLLATPHLIIGGGLSLYVFSGILAFFASRDARLSGGERNSLKLITIGAGVIPLGWVIDESSHRIFGVDMTAWSPPHVVIFLGMIAVLLGLAFLEANRAKQQNSTWLTWSQARLAFILASIFFVALFFFIDFDVPGMAYIRQTRPDFSYASAQTGVIVFLVLLTRIITQRPGAATVAAFIAWAYYTGIGLHLGVIDVAGDEPHRILPPFPIFVPALAADLLFFLWGKRFPLPIYRNLIITIISALACYGGIIAWSEFYTHLPQQGPESTILWLPYVLLILTIALCAETAAFLLSRWALKNKNGSI